MLANYRCGAGTGTGVLDHSVHIMAMCVVDYRYGSWDTYVSMRTGVMYVPYDFNRAYTEGHLGP